MSLKTIDTLQLICMYSSPYFAVKKKCVYINYPFLNLINSTLDVRNTKIHITVEKKPM